MEGHVEKIILHRLSMPEKVLLNLLHPKLHFQIFSSVIKRSMFFKFGMSFSATNTEKPPQSNTPKNGGTKLSDIITGTHS
ncbi:LOW QUALITY PROTEIN: uncharacterized protein LOC131158203 [Malania oleifera]|uniref:LOW QUALITY PROTEIN: uncharacterized protein LOC131158203 n=1 Tax=Malania oleifera TaxID=397392 RepID=UPI0025AEBAE0|nr:LOW QUALITY PROTEIN: uncharacterized protein LOC131158203 [Malania oleifera]